MTALGRFDLRDPSAWDLLTLFSQEKIVRYMGLRPLQDLDQALELQRRYASGPSKWLAVYRGERFEGIVGFEVQRHQATITIAFMPHARGAGREFSRDFVTWLFSHPQIWRVWAFCHVDNVPVQRVLERMGAVREGRLRRFEVFPNISDEPQDVFTYSIVR